LCPTPLRRPDDRHARSAIARLVLCAAIARHLFVFRADDRLGHVWIARPSALARSLRHKRDHDSGRGAHDR
jgi:hypothetical protein